MSMEMGHDRSNDTTFFSAIGVRLGMSAINSLLGVAPQCATKIVAFASLGSIDPPLNNVVGLDIPSHVVLFAICSISVLSVSVILGIIY